MKLENIHESKAVRVVIITIGAIIFVLTILFIGMSIGEHRARFAGEFGNNFERNFLGPRGRMVGGYLGGMLPGGHGAAGQILSVNLPQIIISGQDNLEKTVLVNASTTVRLFQENIMSSDLKAGDFVIVIGNPDSNGQIEASFIRVMPQPMMQPAQN